MHGKVSASARKDVAVFRSGDASWTIGIHPSAAFSDFKAMARTWHLGQRGASVTPQEIQAHRL